MKVSLKRSIFWVYAHQREEQSRAICLTARDDPQTHASEDPATQGGATQADARSRRSDRPMAQIGHPRSLQLLRCTRKHRSPVLVPAPGARAMVADNTPPDAKAPDFRDTHAGIGSAVASKTKGAPSLPGGTLRRYTSEIRTGCANQRPSGSVRGAISNDRPYRDRQPSS
jgi:hypothetical protein